MIVDALSKIGERDELDALRMDAQGQFYETELEASHAYFLYCSSFFVCSRSIPRCLKYDNYDLSRQPFAGRPWSHLDAVKHYKGKEAAKIAKDGRAPSTSSRKSQPKGISDKSDCSESTDKGTTTPDFMFRVLRDGVVEKFCAVGELKLRTKSESQSIWYLSTAFAVFECQLGFTIVDWSFCLLAMMEDEHGRWDAVVLEANDKAVKKFHSQYGDVLSANDLDNLEEVWSDMPNSCLLKSGKSIKRLEIALRVPFCS